MRRSRIKKKSPSELTKLKDKLWELCKKIVRKRDGTVCTSCGKKDVTGANAHTGHMIPSATCGAYLRYDLRNLHVQCYYCNMNLGGNGALYAKNIVERYGQDFLDSIFRDKQVIVKADKWWYEEKIAEYTEMAKWSKKKLIEYTKNLANEN